MESELAFQPRVVELINIPFSFAVQHGATRRSVFPRNKQTRQCYETKLSGTTVMFPRDVRCEFNADSQCRQTTEIEEAADPDCFHIVP